MAQPKADRKPEFIAQINNTPLPQGWTIEDRCVRVGTGNLLTFQWYLYKDGNYAGMINGGWEHNQIVSIFVINEKHKEELEQYGEELGKITNLPWRIVSK